LVKICGINHPAAMAAAVDGGAAMVGLVFYPRSPRAVTSDQARAVAARVPERVTRVGVFVDPPDALIAESIDAAGLGLIQLHGREDVARVAAIRARFGLPVMKAITVANAADLDQADRYRPVVDRLLFDARAEAGADSLPGGIGKAFDWRLLAGRSWSCPWLLSGGLNEGNLAEAVAITGARGVDVSSGVEDRPGVKSPARIVAFLDAAAAIDPERPAAPRAAGEA